MAEALVILADGFEETEALVPVDLLRRAGVGVTVAALKEDTKVVTSSHRVAVVCDKTLQEAAQGAYDAVVLPGGMPGATNLAASSLVEQVIMKVHKAGKLVCAICASPAVVLAPLGLVQGRKAVCYPGFEKQWPEVGFGLDHVVKDGNLITARGAGCAFEFGLTIVGALTSKDMAAKLSQATVYC